MTRATSPLRITPVVASEAIPQTTGDLVLIHGWGIGRRAWDSVLPNLIDHFRVHLVDLPGYEPATEHDAHTSAAPSFADTADALAAAVPDGCIVCGWSLGALLALQAAALISSRIARLVLVGGTPRFTQDTDWPAAQPETVLKAFQDALGGDPDGVRQRFVALFNQGDSRARSITRDLCRLLAESPTPEPKFLLAGLDWLRDTDLRPLVRSVQQPVLLVHGERDPLMPPSAARWLRDTLPQAKLEVFPDAAHAPFLHDPERFGRSVRNFCHA